VAAGVADLVGAVPRAKAHPAHPAEEVQSEEAAQSEVVQS